METEATSQLQVSPISCDGAAPAQTSTQCALVHPQARACLSGNEFTSLSGWSARAVLGLRGSDVLKAVVSAVYRLLVGGETQ